MAPVLPSLLHQPLTSLYRHPAVGLWYCGKNKSWTQWEGEKNCGSAERPVTYWHWSASRSISIWLICSRIQLCPESSMFQRRHPKAAFVDELTCKMRENKNKKSLNLGAEGQTGWGVFVVLREQSTSLCPNPWNPPAEWAALCLITSPFVEKMNVSRSSSLPPSPGPLKAAVWVVKCKGALTRRPLQSCFLFFHMWWIMNTKRITNVSFSGCSQRSQRSFRSRAL